MALLEDWSHPKLHQEPQGCLQTLTLSDHRRDNYLKIYKVLLTNTEKFVTVVNYKTSMQVRLLIVHWKGVGRGLGGMECFWKH